MSWNSDSDANRFKKSYIQGFLDVSGGNVIVESSSTIQVMSSEFSGQAALMIKPDRFSVFTGQSSYDISYVTFAALGFLGVSYQYTTEDIYNRIQFIGSSTLTGNKTFVGSDSSLSDLVVYGNISTQNNGNITGAKNFLLTGDASLNSKLYVAGNARIDSSLLVNNDLSVNQNMFVTGRSQFNNDVSMNRNVDIGTGNNSVAINKDISANVALDVSGTTVLRGPLSITRDLSLNQSLQIGSDLSVNRFLYVGNNALFNTDLSVNQNLYVTGRALFGRPPPNGTAFEVDLSGQMRIYETVGTAATATTGSLVLKHADASGASSIVFQSTNDAGSDYAYIQYQENVGGASQKGLLTIGVENESGSGTTADRISLYAASGSGFVGVNTKTPVYNLDISGTAGVTGALITNVINPTNTGSDMTFGAAQLAGNLEIGNNASRSGYISIGTGNTSKTITVGGASTGTTTLQGGTITINPGSILELGNNDADVAITMGRDQTTGTIDIGNKADRTAAINIGTGSSAKTMSIGGTNTTLQMYGVDASFAGNVKLGSGNKSVAINKDISSNFALDVSGATVLRGALSTLSDVSINGKLSVGGDISLNGNITIGNIQTIGVGLKQPPAAMTANVTNIPAHGSYYAYVSSAGSDNPLGAYVLFDNTIISGFNSSYSFAGFTDPSTVNVYTGTDSITDVTSTTYPGYRFHIDLPYQINLSRFDYAAGFSTNRYPVQGTMLGSNNGSNWYNIYSFDLSATLNNNTPSFTGTLDFSYNLLSNTSFYSKYALVVKSIADCTSKTGTRFIMREIKLYGNNNILSTQGIGTTSLGVSENLTVGSTANLYGNVTIGNIENVYNRVGAAKLLIMEPSGTLATATSGSLVLQHGDASGVSSIVFRSANDQGSDYAYIQYQENVGGGASQKGLLTIGVENDLGSGATADRMSLYAAGGSGFVGVNTLDPQFNLDVSGNLRVSGNMITSLDVSLNRNTRLGTGSNSVAINKDISSNFALDVSGATMLRGVLSTLSDISINGRLFASGDVSLNQKLFVQQDASLNSNLSIGQALTVNSRALFISDVSLNANTRLGAGRNSIAVNKDISSNFALDVSGITNLRAPLYTLSDVSINGKLFATGDASFNTSLFVGQDLSVNRFLYVNSGTLFNGDISTNQNLYVAGKATFGRPPSNTTYELDVSGQIRIYEQSGSNVNSASSVATLTLEHGDASGCSSIMFKSPSNNDYAYIKYQDLSGATTNSGLLTLGIENDATGVNAGKISLFSGNGSGYVGINTLTPAFNLDISGNANVSSSLITNAIDPSNVASTLNIAATQTSGILNIATEATRTGAINIGTGTSNAHNVTIGGTFVGSTTTLQGRDTVVVPDPVGQLFLGNNVTTGNVFLGNAMTGGNLFIGPVGGSSSTTVINFATAAGTRTMSVGGSGTTLNVYAPDVSFSGNVRLGQSNTTNSVSINKDISSNFALDVSGATNLSGVLSTLSDISVNGRLFTSGDVSLNQKLFVSNDISTNSNVYVGNTVFTNKIDAVVNTANIDIGATSSSGVINIGQSNSRTGAINIGTQNNTGSPFTIQLGHSAGIGPSIGIGLWNYNGSNGDLKYGGNGQFGATGNLNLFLGASSTFGMGASMTSGTINLGRTDTTASSTAINIGNGSASTGVIQIGRGPGIKIANGTNTNIDISASGTLILRGKAVTVVGDSSLNGNLDIGSGNNSVSINKDISSNFALDVSGATNLRGGLSTLSDISINGRLFASSDVSLNQKLFTSGDASFNSNLFVGQDLSVNRFLYAANNALFNTDVSINQNLYISGRTAIGRPPTATTYELDVSGQMRIYETVGTAASGTSGSLTLEHGDASGVSSIVFRSKNNNPSDYGYLQYQENAGGSSEKGLLTLGIENDAGSSGASDRISLYAAGGNGFVGVNTKDPLYHLDISGNTRVTGNATLVLDVSMNRNAQIGAGSNSVSINKDISSNFALDVSGATNFRGIVSTLSDISVNGRLFTSGDVSLNQKLFVSSDVSFNKNLAVGQDVSINRNLDISGTLRTRKIEPFDLSLNGAIVIGSTLQGPTGSIKIGTTSGTTYVDIGNTTIYGGTLRFNEAGFIIGNTNSLAMNFATTTTLGNITIGNALTTGNLILSGVNHTGKISIGDANRNGNIVIGGHHTSSLTYVNAGSVRVKDQGAGTFYVGRIPSDATGDAIAVAIVGGVNTTGNVDILNGSGSTGNVNIGRGPAIKIANGTNTNIDISASGTLALTGTTVTAPTTALDNSSNQIATTAFVKDNISNLVGGAGPALDTLYELATAINNDASFSYNIISAINLRSYDADVVHLTGTENIAGNKTFTDDTVISQNLTVSQNLTTVQKGYFGYGTGPIGTPYEFDVSGQMRIYELIGSDVTSNTSVATLTLEHGDASGCSSIMFKSPSTTTNGDYAYIKYQDLSGGTTNTNTGLLTIGVENDPTAATTADKISLYAAGGLGYVGVNTLNPSFNLDICGNTRTSGTLFSLSCEPISVSSVFDLATTQTSGILNIGTNASRTANIFIGNQANNNIIRIGNFDISNNTIKSVSLPTAVFTNGNLTGGLRIGESMTAGTHQYSFNQTSGSVQIAGGNRSSGNIEIGCGNNNALHTFFISTGVTNAGALKIFDGSGSTGTATIGRGNAIRIVNGTTTTVDISASGLLTLRGSSINMIGDVSMNRNAKIGTGNNSVAINKDISSNFALDVSGLTNVRGDLTIVGGSLTIDGVPVNSGNSGTSLTTQGVKVGTDANYFVTIDKTNFYNDPSLVIYYNFDTSYNSGSKIYNFGSFGSTFDGSINGTRTGMIDTTIKKFGAASFKNNPTMSNSGILLTGLSTFQVSSNMSYSFWIYKPNTPVASFDRIFEISNLIAGTSTENNSIALDLSSGGVVLPVLTNTGGSLQVTQTAPIRSYNLCDGNWNHVVWNITPTNSYIYVNGSITQTDTITSAIDTANRTTAYIGYNLYTVDTRDFSGNLDDFRYYKDKALTQAEIFQLSNNRFFNLDICGGFLANGASVIYEPSGSRAGPNSGTLTLLHGDASGSSSIMFKSVNDPLEYGYIQYEENATGSTGYHFGLLTIGIENDGGIGAYTDQADRVSLFPSGGTGFVGVNTKQPRSSLDVSGTMNLNGVFSSSSDISLNGRLFTNGDVSLNQKLFVNGVINAASDISLNRRLFTNGDVSLNQKLFVNGVVNAASDISLNGRLFTNGDVSLNQKLFVNGVVNAASDISLNGRLFTNGDVSLNQKLFVSGRTLFNNDVSFNQNVKIGTGRNSVSINKDASSNFALDVSGNMQIVSTTGTILKLQNRSSIYNSGEAKIDFFGAESFYQLGAVGCNDRSLGPAGGFVSSMSFYINYGGSYNLEGMRITGSGNTTETTRVNAKVYGNVEATSYNAVSDYREKINVSQLNASFTVDVLNPVIYNLKDSGKQDVGFIAHEVQEFYPFLVTGQKDGETRQSLNYNGFIGILTKEIKDLKKKVSEQEERIATQEKQISDKEERLATQEERLQALEKLLLNK